mmetsp:Transcript_11384/g.25084  ORF Transcript_11384/g.25084 Transcript_11384/m.25084 type:complete len:83 (+) Transcript_11384:2101-2349(+)|eukprot:scaffold291_cov207-Alexandrium_tamarense.AAC.3
MRCLCIGFLVWDLLTCEHDDEDDDDALNTRRTTSIQPSIEWKTPTYSTTLPCMATKQCQSSPPCSQANPTHALDLKHGQVRA